MANNHGVIKDTDPHFIIDPVSRKLSTKSTKIALVQGDHKSERFTFELPQTVEGHNMQLTDKVQIHYINIDQLTKAQSEGVWEADDVAIIPATDENPAKVTFSWLIEDKATKYQGVLNFVVRFVCYEGSIVTYSWSTAIHMGIQVASGINVGSMVVEEYIDILRKWENDLKANQVVKMEQTQTGDTDGGENIWTVTFGDGRTSKLTVRNGSRGPTGYIGSIETVKGEPLHFFVGTKAEYEALTEAQRLNCFCILTDDTTEADLFAALDALQNWKAGVMDGSQVVAKAKAAETAATANTAANATQAALALEANKASEATLLARASASTIIDQSALQSLFGISTKFECGKTYESSALTSAELLAKFPGGVYLLQLIYYVTGNSDAERRRTAVGTIDCYAPGQGVSVTNYFRLGDSNINGGTEAKLTFGSDGTVSLYIPKPEGTGEDFTILNLSFRRIAKTYR